MGRRYQLCLDARRLVVSGRDPGSTLPARYRLGRQQSNETRSCDPGAEHGHCVQISAKWLHPSHGSRVAMLFSRLSENPAAARLQSIDERHGKLSTATPLSRRSSKPSRLSKSGGGRGKQERTPRLSSLNISMGFTLRDAATQHWAGKAPSRSNGKRPKRALGAAQKCDRIIQASNDAVISAHGRKPCRNGFKTQEVWVLSAPSSP